MTKKQIRIVFFFIGIFLLSMTYFREELFIQHDLGLWVYRILAVGGLLLVASSFGRLFGKKMMWLAVVVLLLLEIGFALLFNLVKNGNELPDKLTNFLGYIYLFHCRDYIVYDDERGRYDDQLFYTLKPGDFEYNNMEFSTYYHVNSEGFRGNENSLNFPEIIYLGDSYTMGWGVEQSENFTDLLGKKLDKKGLNLGIASYGTAREYRAFERIQHDSCKLVVLQFCPNDVNENRAFVENNFQLNISPKTVFEKEILWNKLYQVYFPLKYVHSAIYFFTEKIKPIPSAGEKKDVEIQGGISNQELSDFFVILKKIKESFDGEIVIFNLGMNVTTPIVNGQFKKWLSDNPIQGVHVFPSTKYLSKEDYLPLDTHLKKSGNEKLASGLADFILEKKLLE